MTTSETAQDKTEAVPPGLGTQTEGAETQETKETEADGSADVKQTTTEGDNKTADKGGESPSEIALKFPEGVEPDKALLEKFVPLAKELKLSGEQAQKLADVYLEGQRGWAETAQKRWVEQDAEWVNAAKTDKEIGGEKFEANLAIAKRGMAQFATLELRDTLDRLGLGNHPELIRAFYRVGKALADDSVAGTTGSAPAPLTGDEALMNSIYSHPTSKRQG